MPISSFSFVRVTILSILIGLAALLAIVGVNLWLVRQAAVFSATVALATGERAAIVDLRNTLDDAETGQRGYLLTGNPDYLAPYDDAQRRVHDNRDRIAALAKSDPLLAADVAKLTTVTDAKLAELQKTIDLFNAGQRDASLKLVNTNLGRQLMDEARELFTAMIGRAEARIADATQSQHNSIIALQWVTIGGALVILLVVGGSVWAILSYMRQLQQARQEVSVLNVNLEQRVRERTADLGRANEEIQRFAYIVTHDLRAPLVNIMGFTSELETSLASIQTYIKQNVDGGGPQDDVAKEAQTAVLEEVPEAVSFIRSSTRKMDGLINAILKLSREGRRALRPEWISLDTLFKTAAANLQHQIDDAGGAVKIDTSVSALVSDRMALEQIVGNLLDNAVKYRSPSRDLRIQIRAHEARGQRIIVEVEDNGRGIAAHDHERVFDLFRRSGTQDTQGEGIGLAHVRSMVRNLGGEITLQSQIEQGTTMQLNLPRDLRAILATQTGAA